MLCSRRGELTADVQMHLQNIASLARQAADMVANHDDNAWRVIDKQMENEFGAKERAMGALNEHRKEHGC